MAQESMYLDFVKKSKWNIKKSIEIYTFTKNMILQKQHNIGTNGTKNQ